MFKKKKKKKKKKNGISTFHYIAVMNDDSMTITFPFMKISLTTLFLEMVETPVGVRETETRRWRETYGGRLHWHLNSSTMLCFHIKDRTQPFCFASPGGGHWHPLPQGVSYLLDCLTMALKLTVTTVGVCMYDSTTPMHFQLSTHVTCFWLSTCMICLQPRIAVFLFTQLEYDCSVKGQYAILWVISCQSHPCRRTVAILLNQ